MTETNFKFPENQEITSKNTETSNTGQHRRITDQQEDQERHRQAADARKRSTDSDAKNQEPG